MSHSTFVCIWRAVHHVHFVWLRYLLFFQNRCTFHDAQHKSFPMLYETSSVDVWYKRTMFSEKERQHCGAPVSLHHHQLLYRSWQVHWFKEERLSVGPKKKSPPCFISSCEKLNLVKMSLIDEFFWMIGYKYVWMNIDHRQTQTAVNTVYVLLIIQLIESAIWFCVKVWPLGQRRCFSDAELRARPVPHAAPHSVAALERFPRDGHGGDEEGRERHPQLLPYRPDQTQPPHPGYAPLHALQELPRGQSHHPRDAGETAHAEVTRGERITGLLWSIPNLRSYLMLFNDFNNLTRVWSQHYKQQRWKYTNTE